jgi:DNA-directed RNA polymerase specialized sigma24 family protein
MELPIEFAIKTVQGILKRKARYSHHISRHSEDIQQESLIYVFTNWRKFPAEDIKDVKPFTVQLAKWGVANAIRNKNMSVVKAKRGTFALTVSTYAKDEFGQGDEDRFLRQESTHGDVEDAADMEVVVNSAGLTEKERDLVGCGDGTLDAIANRLGISSQAVHQRIGNAMKKLAAASLKNGVRDTEMEELCQPKFKESAATLKRLQELVRSGTKRSVAARALGISQNTACRYVDTDGNFREYYYEQHKEG